MHQTFKDAGLEAEFERYGYVVVPFLESEEIQPLIDAYWEVGPPADDPQISIFFDYQSTDERYKRAIAARTRAVLERHGARLFADHRLFYPNYVMKWPNPRSGFAPHQDSSFVDEDEHRSLSVWCPLVDTEPVDGIDVGMFHLVPGSHRLRRTVRAHQPQSFAFSECTTEVIEDLAIGVPVRAGEALVFDHRLLHFSWPNASTEPRLVIAGGYCPAAAPVYHFRETEPGSAERYEVDDDFFLAYNPFRLAEGPPAGYRLETTVTWDTTPVVAAELRDSCGHLDGLPRGSRALATSHHGEQVIGEAFCFRCGAELREDRPAASQAGNRAQLCRACAAQHGVQRAGATAGDG